MVAVTVLGFAGTGALAQEAAFNGFSGSGNLGVKYEGDVKDHADNVTANSKITWISNFDLAMSASGTTDGGLTFGAGATVKAGNTSSEVGKSNAYIGGESWTIAIGDLDAASVMGQGLGDVGFDGLGVDDVAVDLVETDGADVEAKFVLGAATLKLTADQTPGVAVGDEKADGTKAVLADVTKQDTEWAAGVSFNLGSTSLGVGMDSEKLMQASIGADLGSFGGTLYFAQRKVDGAIDNGGTPNDMTDDKPAVTNKLTGLGVEITVSAGANTIINAVYAQGKSSDVRIPRSAGGGGLVGPNDDPAAAEAVPNPVSMTDKGFGVGVSHALGGGATLQAGFAKVKKQTKASVGVAMKF